MFDADATQIGVVLIVYNVAGLVASLVIRRWPTAMPTTCVRWWAVPC